MSVIIVSRDYKYYNILYYKLASIILNSTYLFWIDNTYYLLGISCIIMINLYFILTFVYFSNNSKTKMFYLISIYNQMKNRSGVESFL